MKYRSYSFQKITINLYQTLLREDTNNCRFIAELGGLVLINLCSPAPTLDFLRHMSRYLFYIQWLEVRGEYQYCYQGL